MKCICKECKQVFNSIVELHKHACPEQYDELTLKDLLRIYNSEKKAA